MYTNEIFRRYATKEKNFHEAVASQTKSEGAKPDGVSTPDAAVFSVPIALIVSCTVLFFMMFKKWSFTRDKIYFNVSQAHQIPCRKCQFFSGNHHLKCAVHPSVALTEKAIHCSDYCPQNGNLQR